MNIWWRHTTVLNLSSWSNILGIVWTPCSQISKQQLLDYFVLAYFNTFIMPIWLILHERWASYRPIYIFRVWKYTLLAKSFRQRCRQQGTTYPNYCSQLDLIRRSLMHSWLRQTVKVRYQPQSTKVCFKTMWVFPNS